jgi:hypothetical protein
VTRASRPDREGRRQLRDQGEKSLVKRQLAAVQRASEVVDVPGTPRSLRLDDAEVVADGFRLRWSFTDPEVLPGDRAPHGRRIWSPEEGWQALLDHLGRYGAEVHAEDGEIRVVRGTEQVIYRIDPAEWAAYLTGQEATEATDDSEIVPVGTPLLGGLPLWVVDELFEAAGAWGPVIGLVNGRLVGLQVRDE